MDFNFHSLIPLVISVTTLYTINLSTTSRCISKRYGQNDEIVCVCNSTYCDTLEIPKRLSFSKFYSYTSSRSGQRFEQKIHDAAQRFSLESASLNGSRILIRINPSIKYQTIIGFGGALTDATAINYYSVSEGTRNAFLKTYYSPNYGIGYSLTRVPIASCDFSAHVYSYNDVSGDFEMNSFQLASEDTEGKIPILHQVLTLLNVEKNRVGGDHFGLKIFGSPWSAPSWLKTSKSMIGGKLIKDPKYYAAWAKYMVKFLQAYVESGIPMWGITVQNEPADGYLPRFPFQSMLYEPEELLDFTLHYLCPELLASTVDLNALIVMIFDDNRSYLRVWLDKIMPALNGSTDCVKGIATHWYDNKDVPSTVQSSVHSDYPSYFVLPTEACTGGEPGQNDVALGDWRRGELYAHDIMENLLNWAGGWTDWNMGLDLGGGPNWVGNRVDSPVIFNATADEFYKQPMFYTIGHYSKFLTAGAVRIGADLFGNGDRAPTCPDPVLDVVVFETSETYVAILLNPSEGPINYGLVSPASNEEDILIDTLDGHSIKSIVWKRTIGENISNDDRDVCPIQEVGEDLVSRLKNGIVAHDEKSTQ